MMKRIFLLSTMLLGSATVSAALPPYYESVMQIAATLGSPEVTEAITSARLVRSIVKTESGYTITTDDCTLSVKVLANPPKEENGVPMVGPSHLNIEVIENTCTKN